MDVNLWKRHSILRSPDGDPGGAVAVDPVVIDPAAAVDPAPAVDDLSTLFTPEEVTAKKEAAEASKAEETRRAALTDAERAAEDATKAEEAKANEVPEAYEFKVPEGMELDAEVAQATTAIFKELDISQGKADKLTQLYTEKMLPMFAKRQQDTWQATVDGWKTAAQKDPEIGGDHFKQSSSDALRVVNTIGTPALKEAFNQFGLGNHPEFVRVFAKMAQYLKEDSFVDGISKGGETKSIAEKMYPGMNP